jgi:hypothetical protein
MQDLASDLVVEIRRTHTPSTASTSDCISSLLSLREIFGSIYPYPDSGAGLALLISSISAFSEGDSSGLPDIWLDGWGR